MRTTTCTCAKAHVKRGRDPFTGQPAWIAARPGGLYLAGHGWHFYRFEDALAYATRTTKEAGA